MNLPDLTASIYLAAADYPVGHKFPPFQIDRLEKADVPVPGKGKTDQRGVVFLRKVPKGWVANKQMLRQIGAVLGLREIDKTWPGGWVGLSVVGDVRRPDGTRGNAFRLWGVWPDGKQPARAETAVPAGEATNNGG